VAFGPAADIIIPAGETVATVPVVARMTGEIANLAKDQLKIIHGGPEGLQLKQTSPMTGGEDPALWYIFVAGLVAISAMVLPGISGSFILLMLGLYHFMTFTLRSLVYDRDPDALGVTLVFMAAMVIGITGFSRVLRVLLERHQDLTMAALVGMMLASLRKIWPFVETSMAGVESNVLPASLEAQVVLSIVTCMLGIGAVIGLERAGRTALEGD
jgi:putative membrane protein